MAAIALVQVLATAAPAGAPPVPERGAQSPLDLAAVALAQRDVRMTLRIATTGAWTSADLVARDGRRLCVTIADGTPAVARRRICVTRREGRTALSHTALAPDGSELATRPLEAVVSRPGPGRLKATFLPAAAGLSAGDHAWSAQASWTDDGACKRPCEDAFPGGGGLVALPVALVAAPRCSGAAARDPRAPCENRRLRLAVRPSPGRPHVRSSPFCDARERAGLAMVCGFGAVSGEAAGAFALVGDSHAAGMKPALEVVTLARRWRGHSILFSGCPPTLASDPFLPTRGHSRRCARWNRDVLAWLAEHREVRTVFLTAHGGARAAARAGGPADVEVTLAGYRAYIRALRRLRRRVVVIRDTPSSAKGHLRCAAGAVRAGRAPGPACALARDVAVRRDPLAEAAAAMRGRHVRVVDPTPHACDERRCLAVVGGVLVNRDRTHVTALFSASLGPYLLPALDP